MVITCAATQCWNCGMRRADRDCTSTCRSSSAATEQLLGGTKSTSKEEAISCQSCYRSTARHSSREEKRNDAQDHGGCGRGLSYRRHTDFPARVCGRRCCHGRKTPGGES